MNTKSISGMIAIVFFAMFFLVGCATSYPVGLKPPVDSTSKRETTLFDCNGSPLAYVARDDEFTIYSFDGEPLAYLDEDNNVYGFDGRHLGWFEVNIIWNHQGQKVGFTADSCPVFTQLEPFKGSKQFKPFKGLKQFAPFKPFKSTAISNVGLLDFLKESRN